nr:hypothetical protein Q903MT_gene1914 [Picea sitchensis]
MGVAKPNVGFDFGNIAHIGEFIALLNVRPSFLACCIICTWMQRSPRPTRERYHGG